MILWYIEYKVVQPSWLEHPPHKRRVLGSSPSATTKRKNLENLFGFSNKDNQVWYNKNVLERETERAGVRVVKGGRL